MDQQLLGESVGDKSLPHVPLPDTTLPEARPDGSVGEESTSPHIAEEVMVDLFGWGSSSWQVRFLCANLLISGID